jgi:hypothetical protein
VRPLVARPDDGDLGEGDQVRSRPGALAAEGRVAGLEELLVTVLRKWAARLRPDDQVALEATGNTDAIANLLTPLVARVVVSNPSKTRAIAEAKVNTDKVDARIPDQFAGGGSLGAGVVAG